MHHFAPFLLFVSLYSGCQSIIKWYSGCRGGRGDTFLFDTKYVTNKVFQYMKLIELNAKYKIICARKNMVWHFVLFKSKTLSFFANCMVFFFQRTILNSLDVYMLYDRNSNGITTAVPIDQKSIRNCFGWFRSSYDRIAYIRLRSSELFFGKKTPCS